MTSAAANPVVRAVFRLPRSAYLPVLFLGFGVTVLVRSWAWTLVYLIPLLAALFVARRATVVDTERITVRAMFGTVTIPWSRVRGLLIGERGRVSIALDDQTAVLLPYVRVRHLGVLSQVSGDRVPAIPARTADEVAPTPVPEMTPAADAEVDPVTKVESVTQVDAETSAGPEAGSSTTHGATEG